MSGDGNGAGWLLVDTFCALEVCMRFAGHNWVWMPQDGDFLGVDAVGDNAEFVFLDYARYGVVLYVHLRSRVVEKVYQRGADECGYKRTAAGHVRVSPVMMIWPPIFPAQNVGHEE